MDNNYVSYYRQGTLIAEMWASIWSIDISNKNMAISDTISQSCN